LWLRVWTAEEGCGLVKKNRLRVWTAEEGVWTREEETGSGCGLLKKAVWTREEETGSGCGLLKKGVDS